MGDHVGKSVRLAQGVAGADAGHIGEIRGIHSEPFFSVGVGDGVAYVPASYLDSGWGGAGSADDDMGEMDNEPLPTSDTNQADIPSYAKVMPVDSIMAMFADRRKRNHR